MTPPADADPPSFPDLSAARRRLAGRHAVFARIDRDLPEIAWRGRPGGFEGLFRIIVEQQISTRAAEAVLERCRNGLGRVAPRAVLDHPHGLSGLGLSVRKAAALREIARRVEAGELAFAELKGLGDAQAVAALSRLPGVGRWTAEIYLLFCEGRGDLCPEGDLALREGLRLAEDGTLPIPPKDFQARAAAWSPDRGAAAHLLWAFYARRRAPRNGPGLAPLPSRTVVDMS